MKEQRIILGSASPRRSEILEQVGILFEIIPSQKEEVITKKRPRDIVRELSLQKALDVKNQVLALKKYDDFLILSADTMVANKKHIFGKPKDEEEAKKMLFQLQNKKHYVYTGVTMLSIKKELKNNKHFMFQRKYTWIKWMRMKLKGTLRLVNVLTRLERMQFKD